MIARRNQTVVAAARSMLKAKGMPNYFWGETVLTAVYVLNLNRAFRRSVTGMTPYEAWYLRTFGYVAHVREERASSPEEAGRPEHANGLHRLRERHQGLPCL